MEFKKPSEIEDGPVWKGESEDGKADKSESENSETVEFAGEEVPVSEALETLGSMMMEPEKYNIAPNSRVKELEKENEELRKRLDQYERAITDIASAVESLGANQAEIADVGERSTVELSPEAFGDFYVTTAYGLDDA
jgi:predicted RNase H-like nuclease (RuvC/YqgF family)